MRTRDLVVLVGVLFGGGAFLLFAQSDIARKRAVLQVQATAHEARLLDGIERSTLDLLVEVQSGKSFGYFGNDWGVVRIFTRATGDASMNSFNGVEYFYEFEGDQWMLVDTASIKRPEFIFEGHQKFQEKGHTVNEDAYLRYNR